MNDDNFFAAYRATIEERLRVQIARHRSIDPGASTQRIKDMQLAQEIERIEGGVVDPELRDGLVAWVRDLFRRL